MSSSSSKKSPGKSPSSNLRKKLPKFIKKKDKLLSSTAASVLSSNINLSPVHEDYSTAEDDFGMIGESRRLLSLSLQQHHATTNNEGLLPPPPIIPTYSTNAAAASAPSINAVVRSMVAPIAGTQQQQQQRSIGYRDLNTAGGILNFDADYIEHVVHNSSNSKKKAPLQRDWGRRNIAAGSSSSSVNYATTSAASLGREMERARLKQKNMSHSAPPSAASHADYNASNMALWGSDERFDRGGSNNDLSLAEAMGANMAMWSRDERFMAEAVGGTVSGSGGRGGANNNYSNDEDDDNNEDYNRGNEESHHYNTINKNSVNYAQEHHALIDAEYANSNNSANNNFVTVNTNSRDNALGQTNNNNPTMTSLPVSGEVDLLQQAIERRLLLHNRIAAMEAAKDELTRSSGATSSIESNLLMQIERKKQEKKKMKKKSSSRKSSSVKKESERELHHQQQQQQQHLIGESSVSGIGSKQHTPQSSSYKETSMRHPPKHNEGATTWEEDEEDAARIIKHHPSDEDPNDYNNTNNINPHNTSNNTNNVSNNQKKMKRRQSKHKEYNEVSERIKLEAQEFMNFESKYAGDQNNATADYQQLERSCRQKAMDRILPFSSSGENDDLTNEEGQDIAGCESHLENHVTGAAYDDEMMKSFDGRNNGFDDMQGIVDEGDDYNTEDLEDVSDQDISEQEDDEEYCNKSDGGDYEGAYQEKGEVVQGSFFYDNEQVGEEDNDGGSSSHSLHQSNNRLDLSLGASDSIEHDSSSASVNTPIPQSHFEGISDPSMQPDDGPTPQQLARYSNMVRLGIPDVAVLRSMERDDIAKPKAVLFSLKEQCQKSNTKSEDRGSSKTVPSLEGADRQDIWTKKGSDTASQNDTDDTSNDDGKDDNDQPSKLQPLCDHPEYSKYYKMLKAKVPKSWVKRVLEVDGKDARVLDLDPNLPLAEQVAGAEVDEDGNIDWDKLKVIRTVSSTASVDSLEGGTVLGGGNAIGERKRLLMASEANSTTPDNIPADTIASVRAELATMVAKAGRLSSGSSTSSSLSGMQRDGSVESSLDEKAPSSDGDDIDRKLPSIRPPNPPNASNRQNPTATVSDISSAAVAASNARMERLRALRAERGDESSNAEPNMDTGRRRQNVDEIRGRSSYNLASASRLSSSALSPSAALPRTAAGSRKQNYDHLPLKDDPRFAKYFQMIRSRVPRSWVERVIEVDDRDPAILDLDPNQSLASQIGEEELVENDASSYTPSLDESGKSRFSRHEKDGSSRSDPSIATPSIDGDEIDKRGVGDANTSEAHPPVATQLPDEDEVDKRAVDAGDAQEAQPPITSIRESQNDDDLSVASSMTSFRDTNAESSRVDLSAKISRFLDRMDSRIKGDAPDKTLDSADNGAPRLSSSEDIEGRFSMLIERFGSEAKPPKDEEVEVSDEQHQLLERSQADISKLSALLAAKLGQTSAGAEDSAGSTQLQQLPMDQSDLAKLQSLLSQVLLKVENTQPESETRETPIIEASASPSNKNAALETLFAKRAALAEAPVPIKNDPEYQKYFKMLKVGLPVASVKQALMRDGKDPSVADFDPEKPYASQAQATSASSDKEEPSTEESATPPNKNAALEALFGKRAGMEKKEKPIKSDPEYQKYFKMLKVGLPLGSVKQALMRDGKDPSIAEMDPDKSYASQIKKGEGKPLVANRPSNEKDEVPLKDTPEYGKFFKMLKMGIPMGAVRQALQKEGKDPDIINMDPEKPLVSETASSKSKENDTPLKDTEYGKFFKMLKMGIPMGAVRQAIQKEGKDPNIIDLDPEKPLSQQHTKSKDASKPRSKPSASKVARKRLHWNKIDESKLVENSFWNQAKDQASLKLVGLDFDNEEFASLFTTPVNKAAAPKKEVASDAKKASSKQKVQLIDGRRRMNGSILLTKFKVDYKALAKQVNHMEYVKAEGNELRGMMQLLPTKDEELALRSYLPPMDAPQSEFDVALAKLGECEQYMAVMLDVPDAKDKFQCMVFRAEFEQHAESIRDGTKMIIEACNSVRNSERFRKVLVYALKLGNALNTGGSTEDVTAITLDSLLKLAEAKAFDRQTSVLHYLVSIVQKNDEDVLKLSEDFVPVKAAERVAVDMISQQLREMSNGIKLVKKTAIKYVPDASCPMDEDDDTAEEELLGATPIGKFSLSAESKIKSLSNEFDSAKSNFADLLEFFGEDSGMTPEAFFRTVNSFVSMFDQTRDELLRKQEAKERKMRIDEKRKLREQAAKENKQ